MECLRPKYHGPQSEPYEIWLELSFTIWYFICKLIRSAHEQCIVVEYRVAHRPFRKHQSGFISLFMVNITWTVHELAYIRFPIVYYF